MSDPLYLSQSCFTIRSIIRDSGQGSRISDIAFLICFIDPQILPPTSSCVIWFSPVYALVHAIERAVIIFIFPESQCINVCIDNLHNQMESSPIEVVEMFHTVYTFLKDSSEVSFQPITIGRLIVLYHWSSYSFYR